jgi:hypothetical protein
MASSRMAPIASRLLVVSSLCVVSFVGCSNKRQSMRPVFVGPAVPAASSVVVDDPVKACAPPVIDSGDDGATMTPAPGAGRTSPSGRAPIDSSVNPSIGTTPPSRMEPGLTVPNDPTPPERTPRSNITPPPLDGPAASRSPSGASTRTAGSSNRSRLASLREKVRPFVNDPDDLFQPPKADRPWKFIVVHHSAQPTGSYDQIDREHRKVQGWDGCGYHFVIGNGTGSPDGQIEVARRWTNQKHGLHTKTTSSADVNEYGIGICLVGDFDKTPPTPKQIAATRALVAYLAQRYNVPADHSGTHGAMAGVASACPGKLFPEEQVFGSKHLAQN